MIFGSVCSGIGCADLAFSRQGWRAAFMSEIEPFPRAVLAVRFPGVPLHGDFTTIRAGDYAPIDVLVGGTPCQSFSIAGLRGGLADERGSLALEYLRLADRLRPRWVVWENVPGVLSSGDGRDFGAFLGGLGELGYGFAYRVLDAQHFGVAQRRRRVFVVGCLGDWRPAAAVLFEPASLRGDPPPRREAGQGVARPLAAGSPGGSGYRNDADTADNLIARCVTTGEGRRQDAETCTLIAHSLRAQANASHRADSDNYVAHSLRAEGFDASEDGTGRGTPLVFGAQMSTPHWQIGIADTLQRKNPKALASGQSVRRLTPRECERLQGLPDDWTLIPWRGGMAPDGPRYRAIGNGMAVPAVVWIAKRIGAADAGLMREAA